MTPAEIYDELAERCDQVWVFMREDPADNGGAAMGAIIQTLGGGFMAAEFAMTPDGLATVTARAFDENGEPVSVGVLELDRTVMLTA